MPIYRPGERFRYHRILSKNQRRRSVTATLSLTAMVDMFTVLVIFLLQNYNSQDFLIYTPRGIDLPQAEKTKELKPAFIVSVSQEQVFLDQEMVASFSEVQANQQWLVPKLYEKLRLGLQQKKEEASQEFRHKVRQVVGRAKGQPEALDQNWSKVTLQADKKIDFLSLKKLLYTITEAGAGEINFAVAKKTGSR